MKSIGAKVSDAYYNKIEEIADSRNQPMSQIVIEAIDHYLVGLRQLEIKRVFKPKITMGD